MVKIVKFVFLICGVFVFFNRANAQAVSSTASNDAPVDSAALQEVVVKATRPLTQFKEDGVMTTIVGTTLSKLGTVKDVLGFIPGVSNINGNIEVFGKGTPTFYINGRIMRNPIELEQLSSDKIKDITVINNPGVKYGSNTKAVIRITTVKAPGDGFAVDTKTTLGYKDYLYGKEQVGLNYRTGGFDLYGMFEYDNTHEKGSNVSTQNTWLEKHSMTTLDMDSKGKSQLYNGQIGMNYTTKSNHSFGIYYKVTGKPGETHTHTASSSWLDGQLQDNSLLSQEQNLDYLEHLVDGYYSGTWGKWTADLTFDFLWRINKDRQQIEEKTGTGMTPITIRDKNNGRMLAGEFRVSRPFWKGNLNLGVEYTSSTRKEDFYNREAVISDNNDRIEEDNAAVYGELSQRFGPLTMLIGIRYEHTNSSYYVYGQKQADKSKRYDEFLPSATLTLPIREAMFQIGYSRKYTRPLYSQLSSTVNYVNQYIYETGNPLLKTTYRDNVSLNFMYKWLMVAATYEHVAGQIITSCSSYDDDPVVTLLKKDNSPNDLQNLQVMASVMPGFIGKIYYPVLSVGVLSQFYEIDYRGKEMDMNRPMVILQFNNMFRFPHAYLLTANFRYRSNGDSDNIRMGKSWQMDLSATKTFGKHWNMKLSLNDLFNTAKETRFTMYSGIRDVQMVKSLNTRSAELSIGYKFNMPKSRYKGKGAGNSEKGRL